MVGVLAYNLAENDENIKFDCNSSNIYQNSHEEIEEELEDFEKYLAENN